MPWIAKYITGGAESKRKGETKKADEEVKAGAEEADVYYAWDTEANLAYRQGLFGGKTKEFSLRPVLTDDLGDDDPITAVWPDGATWEVLVNGRKANTTTLTDRQRSRLCSQPTWLSVCVGCRACLVPVPTGKRRHRAGLQGCHERPQGRRREALDRHKSIVQACTRP